MFLICPQDNRLWWLTKHLPEDMSVLDILGDSGGGDKSKQSTHRRAENSTTCSAPCYSSALALLPLQEQAHMEQSLTRVSISRKSREEMSQFFLSRAGEMIFHFSFSSRFSRSQEKNSLSLLDLWDFIELFSFTSRFSRLWRKISLSPLDLWDFIELFSFTSRFSRLWRKISPFTLDCQDCVVPVSLSLPVGNGLFLREICIIQVSMDALWQFRDADRVKIWKWDRSTNRLTGYLSFFWHQHHFQLTPKTH